MVEARLPACSRLGSRVPLSGGHAAQQCGPHPDPAGRPSPYAHRALQPRASSLFLCCPRCRPTYDVRPRPLCHPRGLKPSPGRMQTRPRDPAGPRRPGGDSVAVSVLVQCEL